MSVFLPPEDDQSSGQPVLHLHPIDVHVYQLTEAQLSQLSDVGLSKSLNALFSATMFGALVTLILWGFTAGFDSLKVVAIASAGYVVFGVLLIFFGLKAWGDYKSVKRLLGQIKNDST